MTAFHASRLTRVAAMAAFLVVVPSALWRVLMVEGLVPGTDALRLDELATSGRGYVYGLSVVQLITGFAGLGLARPWGRRLAGVRLPTPLVAGIALSGAAAVTWLFTVSLPTALAHGARPDQGLVDGGALVVMIACYAPIVAWGPLLATATVGYVHDRRPGRSRTLIAA